MSDDINVTLYDEIINVVMDDEQPIEVTIGGGSGFGSLDIFSNPPSGCYRIVNIYLNASKHVVIVYDETPVS